MDELGGPNPELVAEAQRVLGGWVYEIDGDFPPGERVSPEAIVAAWKVDDRGSLTGERRLNPAT